MRAFLTALFTGSAAMSAVIVLYLALLPLLSKRYGARGLYGAGLAVLAGFLLPFRVEIVLPAAIGFALGETAATANPALPPAAAVHWCNPLVFCMAKQVVLQCERACDETLLSQTGERSKQLYLETILQSARRQVLPLPALTTNFSGGKREMKKRIGFILDACRKKKGVVILAAAAMLSFAAGSVTASWGNSAGNGGETVFVSEKKAVITIRLEGGDNRDNTTFFRTMYRPTLQFYIEGEDLAKVELRSESEFLSAVKWIYPLGEDSVGWTQNLPVNGYDKFLHISYEEGFTAYANYWYNWTPLHLEEDYNRRTLYSGELARILTRAGHAAASETVSTAHGSGVSLAGSAGQGKLDGYPAELLQDTITITATDREGRVAVRKIHLQIAYDAKKQVTLEARVTH